MFLSPLLFTLCEQIDNRHRISNFLSKKNAVASPHRQLRPGEHYRTVSVPRDFPGVSVPFRGSLFNHGNPRKPLRAHGIFPKRLSGAFRGRRQTLRSPSVVPSSTTEIPGNRSAHTEFSQSAFPGPSVGGGRRFGALPWFPLQPRKSTETAPRTRNFSPPFPGPFRGRRQTLRCPSVVPSSTVASSLWGSSRPFSPWYIYPLV